MTSGNNAGDRQASVEAFTATAYDYNGDFHAMFDLTGIPPGDFNGRFLQWINNTLGTSYTEINGAMAAFAVASGFANWNAVNTMFTIYPGAAIDLNFGSGLYFAPGAGPLTVSRASVGMAQNLSGNWVSFPANTLRRTNQGALIEESRTNSVRNATMQGASVGSPGTSPTNWFATGTNNGVTVSVIGLPTINGLPAITYSVVGTPTSTFGLNIFPEAPTAIPALYGQTWTLSMYISATNQTNIGAATGLQVAEVNGVGAGVGTLTSFGVYPTPTLSLLSFSFTPNNPATAYLYPSFQFNMQSGLPVNFNVTVAPPQLELNPLINATVASAVMAASGTGGVNGTAVYQVSGGTGTAATLNCTWAAGVLTVNSVASAGSYSVLPPSPATLTYVSGAATGWTGATVTLTPTNNSAQGFATSPILTSGSALQRAADFITMTISPISTGAILGIGTPESPSANPNAQLLAEVDDGTYNNRLYIYRGSGNIVGEAVVGGTGTFTGLSGWAQGASGKAAVSQSVSLTSVVFNNSAPNTGASGAPNAKSVLGIGNSPLANIQFNGYVQRVAISQNTSLIND